MEQLVSEIGITASVIVGLYLLLKYIIEKGMQALERLITSVDGIGKGLMEVSMQIANMGERVGKIEEDIQDIKEVIRVEDMLNKSKKETITN